MSIDSDDWKSEAFGKMASAALSEENEVLADQLIPSGGWKLKLMTHCIQAVYPKLDFASLADNGFSSTQLGIFFGHYLGAFSKCDEIKAFIDEKVARMEVAYQDLLEKREPCLAQCSPAQGLYVRFQFRRVALIVDSAKFIQSKFPELIESGREAEKCILDLVARAASQFDRDSEDFLKGFRQARAIETLSGNGRVIATRQRDQKALDIRMMLLLFAPRLTRKFKSVPSLHETLADRMPSSSLCRDRESLEWDQDFKSVEYVCRDIGLKLRKVGRPRKH